MGGGTDLTGVAWGKPGWIVVGADGSLLSSTDGSAWTRIESGLTHPLTSITWDGNRYLALSAAGQSVAASTDGKSWKSAEFADLPASGTAIAAVPGSQPVYVAAGAASKIASSSNPLTAWQPRSIPGSTKASATSVIWSSVHRKFIATMEGCFVALGDATGASWEAVPLGSPWDSQTIRAIGEAPSF
ncbi:hypothetical protein ACIRPT_27400 [Streptomyces sp. NPDC101227]|uniref:hypothetical protein n=1 Tax=Streptomyces sp. NPDC101227 TaxID=3366136 RepID=UPI0037F3596F